MTRQPPTILREALDYLARAERDIFFRWIQRVSRLRLYLGRPETSLEELRDHMPAVFHQLRTLILHMAEGQTDTIETPSSARQHAADRYQQNVPARIVVKEYQLLRTEMWHQLRTWDRSPALSVEEVFLLEEDINFGLDEVIAITLDTFVDLETKGANDGGANDSGSG
jgi:hypothetical protein